MLEDPFVLTCPLGHRLSRLGRTAEWSDIDPQEFIANTLCESIADPAIQLAVKKSPLLAYNVTTLMALVVAGHGVTLMPSLSIAVDTDDVAIVPLKVNLRRQLFTLCRRDETLSPAAAKFRSILHEEARKFRSEH